MKIRLFTAFENGQARVKAQCVRMFGGDSSIAELLATLPFLFWAVKLYEPECTFCSAKGFVQMEFMTEDQWALVFIVIFGTAVLAWLGRVLWLRKVVMLVSVFVWLYVARLITNGNPAGIGGVHGIFALAGAIGYLQLPARRRGSV